MAAPIVIGIHGLLNKPPKNDLERWWEDALAEGLRRNGYDRPTPEFALAYWADVRNERPILLAELDEPYVEAGGDGPLERYDTGLIDGARVLAGKWGGTVIDKGKDLIGVGPRVEQILEVRLEDLGAYYADEEIRRQVRERVSALLERHRYQPILLIAHSMGSIIGYDVLRQLESMDAVNVQHLITIGSPLGLPLVCKKIRGEFGRNQRTPSNVHRWTNLSDPGDKVALDCNLKDDFGENREGVQVEDVLVTNGYVAPSGGANNHKSYGYLRTPELSDLVDEFLSG